MSEYEYYAHRFNPTIIEVLRDEFMKLGPYWWMAWNAILAVLPVILALVFLRRRDQGKSTVSNILFVAQAGIVMLFLPNAPYVVTDMVHFLEVVRLNEHGLWRLLIVEFPLYVGFIGLGLLCYAFTVDRLLYATKVRFGRTTYWSMHLVIPLLNAIGIYLGRVSRFNSWDILIDPMLIAREGKAAITDAQVATIIGVMTLLLYLFHLAYRVFHDGIKVRLMRLKERRESMKRLSEKRKASDMQQPEVSATPT